MALAVASILVMSDGVARADTDYDAAKDLGIATSAGAGALLGGGVGSFAGPLGTAVGTTVGGALGAAAAIEGNRRYDRAIRGRRGGGGGKGGIRLYLCPTPVDCGDPPDSHRK